MIIVGIRESRRILQNFPDSGHQLIQKLSPLGVVEQRPPDRRDLDEAGERQRRQGDWQRRVEVEEKLQRAELEKSRSPTCRDLKFKRFYLSEKTFVDILYMNFILANVLSLTFIFAFECT